MWKLGMETCHQNWGSNSGPNMLTMVIHSKELFLKFSAFCDNLLIGFFGLNSEKNA